MNYPYQSVDSGLFYEKINNKLKENKNISTHVQNIKYDSKIGKRALEIKFDRVAPGVFSEALVDVFFPQELHELTGKARERFFQSYNFISSPLLYSGQTIESEINFVTSSDKPINVKCFINMFGKDDEYESCLLYTSDAADE